MGLVKGVLAISLLIGMVFGVLLITQYAIAHVYAWSIDADYIHCNWLWCDVGKSYQQHIVHTSRTCLEDGEPINCSELDELR